MLTVEIIKTLSFYDSKTVQYSSLFGTYEEKIALKFICFYGHLSKEDVLMC